MLNEAHDQDLGRTSIQSGSAGFAGPGVRAKGSAWKSGAVEERGGGIGLPCVAYVRELEQCAIPESLTIQTSSYREQAKINRFIVSSPMNYDAHIRANWTTWILVSLQR